ncbi:hypothetical protein F511_12663 [Dorcoceras hygrometricum]|uniref:Uncharacterized protein n=1 Tax=Dorcoceras hygrometricum TaxID=472368 RepID=A0A2Z7CEF7_9LAMI|nr:hypothetical protein F511_12663 [Dorcoceras hygrometricum]
MPGSMRKCHVLVTTRGISSKSSLHIYWFMYLLVIDVYLLVRELVVASAEEQVNDIRTATKEDQRQLKNLFIVIHFRSGGSISCLNTQHNTYRTLILQVSQEVQSLRTLIEVFENRGTKHGEVAAYGSSCDIGVKWQLMSLCIHVRYRGEVAAYGSSCDIGVKWQHIGILV